MTPPAPACATDFVWWAFLFAVSVLSALVALLLKKGVIERLDTMAENQQEFQKECHRCHSEYVDKFVPRPDYERLLNVRQEAHKVINERLVTLENGQLNIANQIETFHRDMAEKITRLSMSFVIRDAVLSTRVDNISGKVGIEWSEDTEKRLVDSLSFKIEAMKG